jgi:hypothetical protein
MKRFIICVCALCCLVSAAASALADWDSSAPVIMTGPDAWDARAGQTVEVSGRVRLLGNVPFTELVVSDDTGHDWYIDAESREALAGLEQQTVTISATLSLQAMTLADGSRLEDRRVLSKVVIIKTTSS